MRGDGWDTIVRNSTGRKGRSIYITVIMFGFVLVPVPVHTAEPYLFPDNQNDLTLQEILSR